MNDYAIALLERFGIETPETAKLREEARSAEQALKAVLTPEQRKLLLNLTDCHQALREAAALSGFLSGCRLAEGVHRELAALPSFSVEEEDAARARRRLETERMEKDE